MLNDEQSTSILLGLIQDYDGGGRAWNLEAERRLGESFRLEVEARAWSGTDDDPALAPLERDDYVRLALTYFF